MEFKVKAIDGIEQKSVQEVESELLKSHEEKHSDTDTTEHTNEEVGEQVETNVEAEVTAELKEEDVLSFIKNRYEKEFTSVDQIFEQKSENEDLPEDVKAYFEYKKTTGRGIEDYVKLNRDFSTMDEDSLLEEYLLASGEATDLEDVEVLMDDYTFDEELDEEKDIKKIKMSKKKAIAKAKKFFEEQKEMYKQPVESSGTAISEEQQKELETYKQY